MKRPEPGARGDAAAAGFVSLLESLQRHAPNTTRTERRTFQSRLAEISASVNSGLSEASWKQVCLAADNAIASYTALVEEHFRRHEEELRLACAGLCQLAAAVAPTQPALEVRFRQLGERMRRLAARHEVPVLLKMLERELAVLERFAREPETCSDNLARLASSAGGTPAFSELPDRFEALAALARLEAGGEPACVINLRIERLGSFVERHGMHAAESLLKQISRRIGQHAPSQVFRWDGGEFLAFAKGRARDLAPLWLPVEGVVSGIYHLRFDSEPLQFAARLTAFLVDHSPGETLECTLGRGLESRLQRVVDTPAS